MGHGTACAAPCAGGVRAPCGGWGSCRGAAIARAAAALLASSPLDEASMAVVPRCPAGWGVPQGALAAAAWVCFASVRQCGRATGAAAARLRPLSPVRGVRRRSTPLRGCLLFPSGQLPRRPGPKQRPQQPRATSSWQRARVSGPPPPKPRPNRLLEAAAAFQRHGRG